MMISLPKLKAMLLFFGSNTDTKFLGKVKLMKLFYFADFMHVKRYGSPITYDNYVKLEHGPIPSAIKNLVDTASDDLDSSVLADTIYFENPVGTKMCRVLPNRKFSDKDNDLFSLSEMEIMKKVVEKFGDKNTQYIEDASHSESAWKNSKMLDSIPYTMATNDSDSVVSGEEVELLMKIVAS